MWWVGCDGDRVQHSAWSESRRVRGCGPAQLWGGSADRAGLRYRVSSDGTHRTMLVDVAMAQRHTAPIILVVRALLLAEGRLRILEEVSGQLIGRTPDELNWNVLAAADCWVGVSTAAIRCLLAHVPQGVRVERIYNGIPVSAQWTPRTPGRVRPIGIAARAEPWKRIDRLFPAVAALPEHLLAPMSVHVFGEDPELARLQRQTRKLGLADRTIYHGHIGPEWTQQCDVLMSTCEIETFGRVIFEAGAAGIPHIVPDQGGTAVGRPRHDRPALRRERACCVDPRPGHGRLMGSCGLSPARRSRPRPPLFSDRLRRRLRAAGRRSAHRPP
jgi:glycosyltransferase involved in cell wall biosynthesis